MFSPLLLGKSGDLFPPSLISFRHHRLTVCVIRSRIIVGAFGLVSNWLQAIPPIASVAADGFSALFFLAGGIAWAVGMKGASCTESSLKSLYNNPLLNQGCEAKDGNNSDEGPYCYVAGKQTEDPWPLSSLWPSPMKDVCEKAYTNESFQFLGFAVCAILVILGFLTWRKQGGKPRFVV